MSELESLKRGWDDAAKGYDAYFVPRFAPWVARAVEVLGGHKLPAGGIVSPCCGTAPELSLVGRAHPDRALIGIDLSPQMLKLAKQRLGEDERVSLLALDASASTSWPRPIGGLVSCFGLQQLPAPEQGLAQWMHCLEPDGLLSVVFWPVVVEADGPFTWLRDSITQLGLRREQYWEAMLVDAVKRGGGELLVDELVSFEMRHDSAQTFWSAVTDSGPLRALSRTAGDEFMEALRLEFLSRAPIGELVHTPQARHMIARRH